MLFHMSHTKLPLVSSPKKKKTNKQTNKPHLVEHQVKLGCIYFSYRKMFLGCICFDVKPFQEMILHLTVCLVAHGK